MRLSLIAASAAVIASFSVAQAAGVPAESCLALGPGYSHVAATVAHPEDCCTGRMQCAQYLSTTTVVRPAQDQHT